MKKTALLAIVVLLTIGCAVHSYRSEFEFAGKLAREGLWREAVFRLQKARAQGKDSAALHNNLAVALEGLGRWDEARGEYELALKREPGNAHIRSNYDRFKKNQEKNADEK
ncbi:MAG: tetratricopeptide repeat protein [Candidatus Aminicenantes bacterium]|nr:tetratricopeptide repeat protein [Candidatus Aminicenantes bacterium]